MNYHKCYNPFMKSYCERCKKDIGKEVDKKFEKIVLGTIQCPHCNYRQNRFVSQTDLYLYNGICEVIYLPLTLACIWMYDNVGTNLLWLIPMLIVLGLIVPIQKNIGKIVYNKKLVNVSYEERTDEELQKKLRKDVNTSFMIYALFALLSIIYANYRIEFIFGEIIIIVITFVKVYLSINKK